jgi:hypothetical protein
MDAGSVRARLIDLGFQYNIRIRSGDGQGGQDCLGQDNKVRLACWDKSKDVGGVSCALTRTRAAHYDTL